MMERSTEHKEHVVKLRKRHCIALVASSSVLFGYFFAIRDEPRSAQVALSNATGLLQVPKARWIMRPTLEVRNKTITYTVMNPVREQRTKTIHYTQATPVRETRTRLDDETGESIEYVVCKVVKERKEKTVNYTVCKMIPETRTKNVSYTVTRMVREELNAE
ncbi:YTV protein [Neorhodopirellula lusitana]|uniref:YTV protein n=1 Tax=Neorhodopirellula lusitana TaxID=445327 RepID=A0ABY1QSX4_9BACT|nr:hypothetical protein [Neorhodopirellula lusitana]SMP79817.1 YTV protein [Neorhodopirellula lusitana]